MVSVIDDAGDSGVVVSSSSVTGVGVGLVGVAGGVPLAVAVFTTCPLFRSAWVSV